MAAIKENEECVANVNSPWSIDRGEQSTTGETNETSPLEPPASNPKVVSTANIGCDTARTPSVLLYTMPETNMDNQLNHRHPLPTGTIVVSPKGEFIAGGTTSLVERLPSGDIIKTPWAGDIREDDCRREIAIESQIYHRLGEHALLVKLKGWNPDTHTLTLEYMSNGTLEEYVKSHLKEISLAQKLRWVIQVVDALHLLHSAGVIHCDVGPHNLLLDADLCLKIADFSGSSLDGSPAMVCPGPRYVAPDPDWRPGKPPTVEDDLFALGSTVYYILTGKAPFEELPDDLVQKK
jgi:serine/threonine protein kinase